MPGLGQRLVRELHSRLPGNAMPKLLQPPEYMPAHTLACASWMGAAVLSKVQPQVVAQQLQCACMAR